MRIDVITLGETMLRFSPPLGESLESAPAFHVDPGGEESNVAVALARLGLNTGWISRLPDDALGRRVAGQIRHHGVDTSRVIWAAGERIGTYYIEPGRSPRSTSLIYDRAGSAFSRIEPDQVDWDYVRGAKWLHLTGITPALGPGPRRTAERAIHEAVESGIVVSFDVNYRAKLWPPQEASAALAPLLDRATIIFCASRDAEIVYSTPSAGEDAARSLHDRFQPRLAVVTEGGGGAIAFDGTLYRSQSIPADTLDPVGSGDAFAAGFIAGYREGDVIKALRWGSALAALKRTFRGDFSWTGEAELQAVLDGTAQTIIR